MRYEYTIAGTNRGKGKQKRYVPSNPGVSTRHDPSVVHHANRNVRRKHCDVRVDESASWIPVMGPLSRPSRSILAHYGGLAWGNSTDGGAVTLEQGPRITA